MAGERGDLFTPLVDDAGALEVLADFAAERHEYSEGNEGGCEICHAITIARRAVAERKESGGA